MMSQKDLEDFLKKIISTESKLDQNQIESSQSFFELGLDSISAIYLLELVEKQFQIELNPIDFWDYPTIQSFSEYIVTKHFK